MRIADTSAVYAVFDHDDAHHKDAIEAWEDPDPILIPAEIMSETLALIGLRKNQRAARDVLHFIRRQPHVEVHPTMDDPFDDILGVAMQQFASGTSLSYHDQIVAAWCRRRRLPALTFDKRLAATITRQAKRSV